ncbi:MAG: kelch repeat-containing protein [Geobacteraceae bacterium]|nr:kelch repeat-containing protein [Geobacteraceae bacterium]
MSTLPAARLKTTTVDWQKIIRGVDMFELPNDFIWAQMPPLIQERSSCSAFTMDGRIWVVGGKRGNGDDADMEVFDPLSGLWTLIKSPFSCSGQVFATLDKGKIYAFGGDPVGMKMPTSVEEYDIHTGVLRNLSPLPVGCWHPAVTVTADGRIYLMGGYVAPASTLDTVQEYNTLTDKWTLRRSMPSRRYDFAAATGTDGKIYAAGGVRHNGSETMAALEIFNPITNSWVSRAPMPTPRRCLALAAVAGNRVCAIGGLHSCSGVNIVEEYDPARNTWTATTPMPTGRWSLASAVMGNMIFVVGGYHRAGASLPGNPNVVTLCCVEKVTLEPTS